MCCFLSVLSRLAVHVLRTWTEHRVAGGTATVLLKRGTQALTWHACGQACTLHAYISSLGLACITLDWMPAVAAVDRNDLVDLFLLHKRKGRSNCTLVFWRGCYSDCYRRSLFHRACEHVRLDTRLLYKILNLFRCTGGVDPDRNGVRGACSSAGTKRRLEEGCCFVRSHEGAVLHVACCMRTRTPLTLQSRFWGNTGRRKLTLPWYLGSAIWNSS